jgi:hypothetical protein
MNEAISIVFLYKTFNKVAAQRLKFVPRVGDRVDLWVNPLPTVVEVIVSPSASTLNTFRSKFGSEIGHFVDAIVIVE